MESKRRRPRWLALLLAAAVLACLALLAGPRLWRTSAVRPPDRYAGAIEQVRSSKDADGDGVDDQTDILQGALAYVASRPRYKSRYYATGYPDDGHGVCTDVVAFALRDAGYDLMYLVEEDVLSAPEAYDVPSPDAAIDFRRVRNLRVYLERHAIPLTTDPSDVGAWQGGDVVVFRDHIGIVSDRRNDRGVPYVIHHEGVWQAAYEQDILESRHDLVGHYRISE